MSGRPQSRRLVKFMNWIDDPEQSGTDTTTSVKETDAWKTSQHVASPVSPKAQRRSPPLQTRMPKIDMPGLQIIGGTRKSMQQTLHFGGLPMREASPGVAMPAMSRSESSTSNGTTKVKGFVRSRHRTGNESGPSPIWSTRSLTSISIIKIGEVTETESTAESSQVAEAEAAATEKETATEKSTPVAETPAEVTTSTEATSPVPATLAAPPPPPPAPTSGPSTEPTYLPTASEAHQHNMYWMASRGMIPPMGPIPQLPPFHMPMYYMPGPPPMPPPLANKDDMSAPGSAPRGMMMMPPPPLPLPRMPTLPPTSGPDGATTQSMPAQTNPEWRPPSPPSASAGFTPIAAYAPPMAHPPTTMTGPPMMPPQVGPYLTPYGMIPPPPHMSAHGGATANGGPMPHPAGYWVDMNSGMMLPSDMMPPPPPPMVPFSHEGHSGPLPPAPMPFHAMPYPYPPYYPYAYMCTEPTLSPNATTTETNSTPSPVVPVSRSKLKASAPEFIPGRGLVRDTTSKTTCTNEDKVKEASLTNKTNGRPASQNRTKTWSSLGSAAS
jgi:hypothetical protein